MTWTSLEIWKIANFSSEQVHRSIADRNWKQIDILKNFHRRRLSGLHRASHLASPLISRVHVVAGPTTGTSSTVHYTRRSLGRPGIWQLLEFNEMCNDIKMSWILHTERNDSIFSLHLSAVVPLKRQILRVSFNNFTAVCRELKRAFVISWIFCYKICQEAVKHDERWSEHFVVGRLYSRWAWIASNFSSN